MIDRMHVRGTISLVLTSGFNVALYPGCISVRPNDNDSAMKRLLHKAMTILLSGAVLASSVLPPAVCHAHSEGDQPHSHEQGHEHADSDQHDHGHGHHHDGAAVSDHHEHRHHAPSEHEDEPATGGIESASAHLHFSIAGFDFSLPLPSHDGSDEPLSPLGDNAACFGLVRLTDDTVTVPRVDLTDLVDLSASAPLASASLVDQTQQTARWLCVRAVDRTLLCDSARCERSGVLLT